MDRITPLAGLQAGVVAILISSAVIALFENVSPLSALTADEITQPPRRSSMEEFMAKKLHAAQKTLAGVAREDFDTIRESTLEMVELSRQSAWERMASVRFVQDTADFVSAAEFLIRMAEAKDYEGTSLGFVRLTLTCTNCHSHVRTANVANLESYPGHIELAHR